MNNQFKEVNIYQYVKEGIQNGSLVKKDVVKHACVSARLGIEGEVIKTIMEDGLEETINIVDKDPVTDKVDWVVTNPNNEQYIVPHAVFIKKYCIDPENPDLYKPLEEIKIAVQINEHIMFKAPWGDNMYIQAGGYLIINSETDIYGIQEQEFLETYHELYDLER